MLSGYEFFKGDWQNTGWLVEQTLNFYQNSVVGKTPYDVTKTKIVERRKWTPSLPYYDNHFTRILEELGILYVPKQVLPGPCILFPLPDYHGRLTHGKINPFYELMLRDQPAKYGFLGKRDAFRGPQWMGMTDEVIRLIARTRTVVLVEGPYDLLACRLLWPNATVVSTGTKSVNDMHIAYLRLLGVKTVYLLFDYETEKGLKTQGAGQEAMQIIRNMYSIKSGMMFEILNCPNDDPAMCMEDYMSAASLRNVLRGIFPQ